MPLRQPWSTCSQKRGCVYVLCSDEGFHCVLLIEQQLNMSGAGKQEAVGQHRVVGQTRESRMPAYRLCPCADSPTRQSDIKPIGPLICSYSVSPIFVSPSLLCLTTYCIHQATVSISYIRHASQPPLPPFPLCFVCFLIPVGVSRAGIDGRVAALVSTDGSGRQWKRGGSDVRHKGDVGCPPWQQSVREFLSRHLSAHTLSSYPSSSRSYFQILGFFIISLIMSTCVPCLCISQSRAK